MATTTNYGWTTPDDTDLVKDGAAAIRTLGSSVDTTTKALNPSTTLGDIEYRSSTANTNTRLGIGSTGNVLTVSGGVPAWAAPASPDSMTLLSTTAITATSSITVSTISGAYTRLIVFVENFGLNTTGNVQMRFNGDSGSNYSSSSVQSQQGAVHPTGTLTSFGTVGFSNMAGTNNASFIVDIPFYANTAAYKNGTFQVSGTYGGTSNPVSFSGGFAYRSTAAISSITLLTAEQLLAQGNIKIYGVK
jgi:hypothetical protein